MDSDSATVVARDGAGLLLSFTQGERPTRGLIRGKSSREIPPAGLSRRTSRRNPTCIPRSRLLRERLRPSAAVRLTRPNLVPSTHLVAGAWDACLPMLAAAILVQRIVLLGHAAGRPVSGSDCWTGARACRSTPRKRDRLHARSLGGACDHRERRGGAACQAYARSLGGAWEDVEPRSGRLATRSLDSLVPCPVPACPGAPTCVVLVPGP
jgi:hypothetical protein